MNAIILYSTRYGCAAETANRIKMRLGGACRLVQIGKEAPPAPDGFDTVILGGSIYIGRVQKELTAYMAAHLPQLLTKKTGLYLCAGEPDPQARAKELREAFPPELFARAAVKDVLGFAFTLDKMRFFDRLLLKKIKGVTESISQYDDDRIARFAETLKNG